MKKIIVSLFLFSVFGSFSQTKIFIDVQGKELKSEKNAVSYKIISPDSLLAVDAFCERIYDLSGKLISESHYTKNKYGKMLNGKSKVWYDNGQLKSEIDYQYSNYNGQVITYWKNGQVKRKDIYLENEFYKGVCYDSTGNTVKHYPFEVMPQFPDGEQALLRYISSNVRYPVEAMKNGNQGKVVVKFTVNTDGSISDIEVIRSIDPLLDAEACRVVRSMPDWKPGTQDGEKARMNYVLPVSFMMQ